MGRTSYEKAQPLKTAVNKIAYCNSCEEVFVNERHGQCPKSGGVSITRTNSTSANWKLMSEKKGRAKKETVKRLKEG